MKTKRLIVSILISTAIMTIITLSTQATNNEDRFRGKGEDILIDSTTQFKLINAKEIGQKMRSKVAGQADCVAAKGKKYLYVEFSATNISQKDILLNSMQLSDENHETYQPDYASFYRCVGPTLAGNPQYLSRDVLYPGVEHVYYAFYEVPAQSKKLKIRFQNSNVLTSEYALLGI